MTSISLVKRLRRGFSLALLGAVGCQDPNPAEESLSTAVPPGIAVDQALRFDGEDDYATLGTARFPMPTLPQTVTFWVRTSRLDRRQALLALRRDDSGNEFGLSESGVPTLYRIWSNDVVLQGDAPLTANFWHHIAFVRDLSEYRVYVDGALSGQSTASTDNRSPTSGWLGSYDGSSRLYEGELDELRIWSMARSSSEILMEIEQGGPSSDPEMVGYYSFDEAGGPRAYDRSGNGNHATLGDGVTPFMPTRIPANRL
ncbi:MAG: LamG domain-containing protein [Polyangiaceae bacterium]